MPLQVDMVDTLCHRMELYLRSTLQFRQVWDEMVVSERDDNEKTKKIKEELNKKFFCEGNPFFFFCLQTLLFYSTIGRPDKCSIFIISSPPSHNADMQRELSLKVMKRLDFNFDNGRLDKSAHPFSGGVPTDTRITTRYDESDFTSALMGVIHEVWGMGFFQRGK